jgi:hypothetical protein
LVGDLSSGANDKNEVSARNRDRAASRREALRDGYQSEGFAVATHVLATSHSPIFALVEFCIRLRPTLSIPENFS